MIEAKNMTATEVLAAEKEFFARKVAEQSTKYDPLESIFDKMVRLLKEAEFIQPDAKRPG